MASWGFTFVEFIDIAVRYVARHTLKETEFTSFLFLYEQSASAVLGATMSPQIHPSGFRISDRPVAASFAHHDSFQPLPDYSLRDEACIMSSASLGQIEGAWVRYWDEASTVAVLEFKVDELPQPSASAPTEKKKEKRKTKGLAHVGLTINMDRY